jgi:hypothetical protein
VSGDLGRAAFEGLAEAQAPPTAASSQLVAALVQPGRTADARSAITGAAPGNIVQHLQQLVQYVLIGFFTAIPHVFQDDSEDDLIDGLAM